MKIENTQSTAFANASTSRMPQNGTPQPAAPGGTTVHLNIERLVVEGVSRQDQGRMTRAMERHFTRLAQSAKGFDWQDLSSLERIDARDFPPGSTAEDIGRHVAMEIFRGLKR